MAIANCGRRNATIGGGQVAVAAALSRWKGTRGGVWRVYTGTLTQA